jgi:hypothetical protein
MICCGLILHNFNNLIVFLTLKAFQFPPRF